MTGPAVNDTPLVLNWVTNQPIPMTPSNFVPSSSASPTTSSYTIQSTDYLRQIVSFSSGGTLTLTFPSTLPNGFIFFVSVINNSITVTTTGGVNIIVPNGSSTGIVGASYTFSANNQDQSATLIYDGGSLWAVTTQGSGQLYDIQFVINGGGSAVTTGSKGWLHNPVASSIIEWRVMADQTGSISIDLLRANNAVPSVSIVGSGVKPNLSSSQFTISAPSSWTSTTLASDDWITFNVSSATTVQLVTICLTCQRA